jgi:hypothetical protein
MGRGWGRKKKTKSLPGRRNNLPKGFEAITVWSI